MREEFETWLAMCAGEPNVRKYCNGDGQYTDAAMHLAWQAWQAARATPALPHILQDIAENSVPLGAEFEAAMMKNLSSMYEYDGKPQALPQGEPVAYQFRMRASWSALWTKWEYCSKGSFEDYKRVPIIGDWHYEARALYEHPQALPQGVEEWMPILGTCLAIPMKLLDESQAKSNHGQTPARLKERGGISLSEAVAIAGKMKWRSLESKRALEILHDLSGMAIVPVDEITPEMWSAGRNEFCRIYDRVRYAMHSEIESAEIDAAPQSMMTAMLAASQKQPEKDPDCECDSCRRGLTVAKKSDADLGKCSVCDHPHLCAHCD